MNREDQQNIQHTMNRLIQELIEEKAKDEVSPIEQSIRQREQDERVCSRKATKQDS